MERYYGSLDVSTNPPNGIVCSVAFNDKGEAILPKRKDTDRPGVYFYFSGYDEEINGHHYPFTLFYIGSAVSDVYSRLYAHTIQGKHFWDTSYYCYMLLERVYLDTDLVTHTWKNDDAYLIEQRLLSIFSTAINDPTLGGVNHKFIPKKNIKMGPNGSPVNFLKTVAGMNFKSPESSVTIHNGPMIHSSLKDKAFNVLKHIDQAAAFDKDLQ
ncbi:hypothetical protein ACTFIZ_010224 [Dictyostelium cf. discoideum]